MLVAQGAGEVDLEEALVTHPLEAARRGEIPFRHPLDEVGDPLVRLVHVGKDIAEGPVAMLFVDPGVDLVVAFQRRWPWGWGVAIRTGLDQRDRSLTPAEDMSGQVLEG